MIVVLYSIISLNPHTMNTRMIKLGIASALFVVISCTGFSQKAAPKNHVKALTLEETDIRTLHSDIVGEDYELWISLPKSYHSSEKIYPVIVLLDAFRSFLMVKGNTDVLITPMEIIPEHIIVGIGYGGTGNEALLKWALGRTRDLTPVEDSLTGDGLKKQIESLVGADVEVHTGGAGPFLQFMEEELFPFIESTYRIDTNHRTLYGYSFGGLFALYALFHNPGLFKNYLIGSPSIHYKDGIMFSYESDYAKNHRDLHADVFISAGELEVTTSENIKKIEALLRSRDYKNLKFETVIFEDEDHYSCAPAAMSRGITESLGKEENP